MNNLVNLLISRKSVGAKKLTYPIPTNDEIEQVLISAQTVPDHASLKPYRIFVINSDDAKDKLYSILEEANIEHNIDDNKKISAISYAPLSMVITTKLFLNHEKVPEWEQLITASLAVYNMQLSLNSLGFSSKWITPKILNSKSCREGFNLSSDNDKIIAILSVGSSIEDERRRKIIDISEYSSYL